MSDGSARTLWRISNFSDLRGSGGQWTPSRWSFAGHRVVFMAESPAGAMLEILVHLPFEDGELPDTYQLMSIQAPEGVNVKELHPPRRADWRTKIEITQRIGTAWLVSGETPLARVPSAIMPRTSNYLLNPAHPDASSVVIHEIIRERFDDRLFRLGAH
jgi:RES domain-containing protein